MYFYTLTFIIILIVILSPIESISAEYIGLAVTIALLIGYKVYTDGYKPLLAIGAGAIVWGISEYCKQDKLDTLRSITAAYLIVMSIYFLLICK